MKLHALQNVKGAVKHRKRVGCGEGGGHGKTSGRGGKGQTARSGGSIRPGFEGGQMPLYRKLPRRGFSNFRFRSDVSVVNLDTIARLPAGVSEVNPQVLADFGVIRKVTAVIKVLGRGEILRSLTVSAHQISESARIKIQTAGGKVIVLP